MKKLLHKLILLLCMLTVSLNASAYFPTVSTDTGTGEGKVYKNEIHTDNKVYKNKIKTGVEEGIENVIAYTDSWSLLDNYAKVSFGYGFKSIIHANLFNNGVSEFDFFIKCQPEGEQIFKPLSKGLDKYGKARCDIKVKLEDETVLDFSNTYYFYKVDSKKVTTINPYWIIDNETPIHCTLLSNILKLKESDIKAIAFYKNGKIVGDWIKLKGVYNSTTIDDMLAELEKMGKVNPKLMQKPSSTSSTSAGTQSNNKPSSTSGSSSTSSNTTTRPSSTSTSSSTSSSNSGSTYSSGSYSNSNYDYTPKKKEPAGWNSPADAKTVGVSLGYVSKQWVMKQGGTVEKFGYWDGSKSVPGFQIGIRFEPQFKYGFALNTGLYYEYYFSSASNVAVEDEYGKPLTCKGRLEEHNLYLPIHLEYRLHFNDKFNLFFFGGAGLDYGLGGKLTYYDIPGYEDTSFDDIYENTLGWKRFNASIEYGLGLRYRAFQVHASMARGLINMSDNDSYSIKQNKNLSVGASIMF